MNSNQKDSQSAATDAEPKILNIFLAESQLCQHSAPSISFKKMIFPWSYIPEKIKAKVIEMEISIRLPIFLLLPFFFGLFSGTE